MTKEERLEYINLMKNNDKQFDAYMKIVMKGFGLDPKTTKITEYGQESAGIYDIETGEKIMDWTTDDEKKESSS